jgi:hypothetical protein
MMENEGLIVFLGPTLKVDEARGLVDADYRPPASRGDIYRATKSDPRIILLIDGAFEAEAAVLHNEILWAISKGVTVFGAASMGALRAAELEQFGMIGFGKIFQAYRDGSLERDDAVAVVHGPAELGYPSLSTALVDVWATLDRALEVGVISSEERKLLSGIASKIFYKQLGLETLLVNAAQRSFPVERTQILRQYLASHGMFSQKRADAIGALETVVRERSSSPAASKPNFFFERTSAWEYLAAEMDEEEAAATLATCTLSSDTELAVIGLHLAEKEAQRRGYVSGPIEFEETARDFRQRNKLHRFSDVQRWMDTAQFQHDDYVNLIQDECFLKLLREIPRARLRSLMKRVNRYRRSAMALTMLAGEKQLTEK